MKSKATVKYLSALALSGALVLSMNATPVSAAKKKAKKKTSAVKSVKVVAPSGSKKSATVAKGKSIKLTVTVNAKKKSFKKVTYKTSNKKVVSVSKKGVVKGKKAGTATIKVISTKDKKKTASIKVKVVGGVVKKVTLNKSKLDLKTGDSGKLSAKVTGTKKAYKTLKWTTSNKKVATVTSKGVVKGIGKGTAKITAKALDGSGKKSTCTVSVSEKNGIKSLEVYNPTKSRYSRTLKVTLDSPQALTADDFKVAVKYYYQGSYIEERAVEDVYTTDNQTYEVYLANREDEISTGNFVRVTVASLNGQKTAETQFWVDSETTRDCYVANLGDGHGREYISNTAEGAYKAVIKSGTLPAGLKLLNTRGNSYVTGDPSAIADNQHVVFEVTDELGKVSTTDMNFLIGDDDHIVVENKTVGDQISGKIYYANRYLSENLSFAGGKGEIKAEILNTYNDTFEVENVNSREVQITADSSKVVAGTYNVPVKLTDSQGKTGQGTLTVIVSPSAKIVTKVNNYNNDGNIYFYNHDKDTEISLGSMYTESQGISETASQYTGYLPQGTYSVYYRMAGRKVMLHKTITVNGDTNLEVTLPTSKITGTIYDVNNKQYTGRVEVCLYRSDDLEEQRYGYAYDYTHDGTYSLIGVPDGQYVVVVSNDYDDGNRQNFKSTSGIITVSGGNVTTDFKLSVSNPDEDPQ